MTQPKWTSEADERVRESLDAFSENIRRIAIRIARHDNSLYIDVKHVDAAIECLRQSGLGLQAWYKRPSLLVGLGVGLFSLSLSTQDFFSTINTYMKLPPALAFVVMISGISSGVVLVLIGWMRS